MLLIDLPLWFKSGDGLCCSIAIFHHVDCNIYIYIGIIPKLHPQYHEKTYPYIILSRYVVLISHMYIINIINTYYPYISLYHIASLSLSVCLPACLSVCLYLSIYRSIDLSISIYICLSIDRSICVYVPVYPYMIPIVYPPNHGVFLNCQAFRPTGGRRFRLFRAPF